MPLLCYAYFVAPKIIHALPFQEKDEKKLKKSANDRNKKTHKFMNVLSRK